jgi:hypothetical protein
LARGNLKEENWAVSLREELYKIEMGCIWQNGKDGDIGVIFQKIVNSCNNIDRHAKIQRMREKKPLGVEWEMKKE